MIVSVALAIVGAMTKSRSTFNTCAGCCFLAAVVFLTSLPMAEPEERKLTLIAGAVCAVAGAFAMLWARKQPRDEDRFES